jgi:hypothetical protein
VGGSEGGFCIAWSIGFFFAAESLVGNQIRFYGLFEAGWSGVPELGLWSLLFVALAWSWSPLLNAGDTGGEEELSEEHEIPSLCHYKP